jgi:hypothetical protein
MDIFTSSPTVNDDNTKGYVVGNNWLNSSTGYLYWCIDATTGAAKWVVVMCVDYGRFTAPNRVDGTGAVLQTDATTAYYGQAKFSNSAAPAGNYVEYRGIVPINLDTAIDLVATFKIRLGGADTGKHRYTISMASVANSASFDAPTLGNAINMDFAGDASGASGDVETVTATLTGWKAALTPGALWVIRIARAGNDATYDTSTVDSYTGPLIIAYGKKQ